MKKQWPSAIIKMYEICSSERLGGHMCLLAYPLQGSPCRLLPYDQLLW